MSFGGVIKQAIAEVFFNYLIGSKPIDRKPREDKGRISKSRTFWPPKIGQKALVADDVGPVRPTGCNDLSTLQFLNQA